MLSPVCGSARVRFWHKAANHISICEGRFPGAADKQGRIVSTAWVEDDPEQTAGLQAKRVKIKQLPRRKGVRVWKLP
jgi:hypothetical protein